ncbi:embryonic protein UVS.2-like [Hyperolius riggenbachi]|uniref:embryonic protein UVS.2-like n=1 Tax=Hyperolius riggenbachi TaxID=752182 RepID=UPI0035A29DF0
MYCTTVAAVLLLNVLQGLWASPLQEIQTNLNTGNLQDLQGDINIRSIRSTTSCVNWPKCKNGAVIVPFILSSDYDAKNQAVTIMALQEITTMSCVTFVQRTTETDYLNFEKGSSCWSYIGKVGGGQTIALNNFCMRQGQIQQLVLYALGFIAEVNRKDRDNYVKILYENIEPAQRPTFEKKDVSVLLDLPYDYSSVMHWPGYLYSSNGKPTIVPILDPKVVIGQIDGVSTLDIVKVNKMYQCDLCRKLSTSYNGTVSSENYPSPYPNNASCLYMIRTPGRRIYLSFEAFSLQNTIDCTSDYLRVYDGSSKCSPVLLNKTCGTTLPLPILSSGNTMLLEFVSDPEVSGTGFKASYTTVTCGGVYTSSTGIVTSPDYPKYYRKNMECIYRIIAPEGYKVEHVYHSQLNRSYAAS